MSTNICSYEGCMVRRLPCSSVAFFAIPTDNRRNQWIVNSGNKDLKKLGVTRTRIFCEKHFHDSDIRTQFHRKILRKSAIPIPYKQVSSESVKETCQGERSSSIDRQELSFENNEIQEEDFLTYSDNVVACEFEIVSNQDSEKELVQGVLSYYEQLDDESMENNECENDRGQLSLECTNFATSANAQIAPKDETLERQVSLTTTTMQDFDKISKQHSEDVQVDAEEIITLDKSAQTSCSTYNDDKHFALSLVGYFQRLNHEKKIIAKLKILSYLTALELGYNEDL